MSQDLSIYFRQILTLEQEVDDLLRATLPGVIDVPEMLVDMPIWLDQYETLTVDAIAPVLSRAALIGEKFVGRIGGGATVASSETPLAEGMRFLQLEVSNAVRVFETSIGITLDRLELGGVSDDVIVEVVTAMNGTTPTNQRPPFATLTNGVVRAARGAIKHVADAAILATVDNPQGDLWTWVTIEDKRVCDDCLPRHGTEHTLAEWTALGKPQTGWSICQERCRCMLLPREWVNKNVDLRAPIKMTALDLENFGTRVEDLVP